jgi:hypothetical protein
MDTIQSRYVYAPVSQSSEISGRRDRPRSARPQTAMHSRRLRTVFEGVYGGQTTLAT